MAKGTTVLLLFAAAVVGQALTPSTFLTTVDQIRLRSVFEAAQPYSDAQSAHYSILGLKLLGAPVPNSQEACKSITSTVDTSSVASLFHASTAAKSLGGCKIPSGNSVSKLLDTALEEKATVADIYHAYFAKRNMDLSVDDKTVKIALIETLKTDDSPLSYGYAFLLAAQLSGDVTKIFDSIEDIVAQADEVDEKYLQFEGGLYVSALIIDGAYKLSNKLKKTPVISHDMVIKFSNYFLSRKHVHQLKSAYYFLSVIKTLTDNKFHVPVAVTLASPVAVSQSLPQVQVRVTNLMGGSLGKLTVMADSAQHLGEDAIFLSKEEFKASKGDDSLFELHFMSSERKRGFYKLTVSVTPSKPDSRLIGTSGAEVEVKVTTKVSIESVEIAISDKDQSSSPKSTKLQHPKKAANPLEADFHQKVTMKFQLKDMNSAQLLTAHQTFVKLTNTKNKQEIIFVAEADSQLMNKFDMDVAASAKDFGYMSGKYTMELIIGDAVIENPISWILADIVLTFPESGAEEAEHVERYKKLPEIEHKFSEPEKLPPVILSTAFTALALLPVLILFALWLKLGVNVSQFPVSLSAVGFHVCLGLIFGLYYCYWTQLNMFQTLRYLGLLSIPTFIFGNRLLSGIAAKRQGQKSKQAAS